MFCTPLVTTHSSRKATPTFPYIKSITLDAQEEKKEIPERAIPEEGRSAGWKLQYLIFFQRNPRAPAMSADSSHVGVALFPSY
jgi:hypothetical protein